MRHSLSPGLLLLGRWRRRRDERVSSARAAVVISVCAADRSTVAIRPPTVRRNPRRAVHCPVDHDIGRIWRKPPLEASMSAGVVNPSAAPEMETAFKSVRTRLSAG